MVYVGVHFLFKSVSMSKSAFCACVLIELTAGTTFRNTLMHQCDDWIICEHCDSVFESLPLKPGQTSICTRCDGVLQQGSALTIEQLFAISIASALLFVFANVFPVIDISFQGAGNQATLWSSVWALARGDITPIAFVAGVCIILAPGLQIPV